MSASLSHPANGLAMPEKLQRLLVDAIGRRDLLERDELALATSMPSTVVKPAPERLLGHARI